MVTLKAVMARQQSRTTTTTTAAANNNITSGSGRAMTSCSSNARRTTTTTTTTSPPIRPSSSISSSSSLQYQPTLTLSFGGVQFLLIPSTTTSRSNGNGCGAVSFEQDQKDMILNLNQFTGSLRVSIVQQHPTNNNIGSTTCTANNVTPRQGNTSSSSKKSITSTATKKRTSGDLDASSSPVPPYQREHQHHHHLTNNIGRKNVKKTKSQAKEQTQEYNTNKNNYSNNNNNTQEVVVEQHEQHSPSLLLAESEDQITLGQNVYSQTQTQFSVATHTVDDDFDDTLMMDNNHSHNNTKHNNVSSGGPSKVQKIMEEETTVQSDDRYNEDDVSSSGSSKNEDGIRNLPSLIVAESPEQGKEEMRKMNHGVGTSKKNTTNTTIKNKRRVTHRCEAEEESSPVTAIPSKGHEPPCARWGHTLTSVGNNRIVLYGGQTFDTATSLPKTLSDLYIYDLMKHVWFKPFNCDGIPRQWHTSTFLPDRNLIISFGGETLNPKTKRSKTTDQVMVLDTEIMLWYPPTISGDIPSPRSGHTATLISKTAELVVFGGVVSGNRWLNTVSILDTNRWVWTTPKILGSAPRPRSYHSAVAIGGGGGGAGSSTGPNDNARIVIFGGNDARESFNTVHVLEAASVQDQSNIINNENGKENDQQNEKNGSSTNKKNGNSSDTSSSSSVNNAWIWKHPTVAGDIPEARTGQTATLLADRKTILVYGGWDPNMEDEEGTQQIVSNDEEMIYGSSYLLNTETWVWSKGPDAYYAIFPNNSNNNVSNYNASSFLLYGEDGGRKRVGHSAVLMTTTCMSSTTEVAAEESESSTTAGAATATATTTNDSKDNEKNNNQLSEVLVFGGRIPGDKFTGDFQVLS